MKRHPALWKEGVAVVCAMSWCLGSVELVACTKLCGDGGLKNVASAVLNSRCRLVREPTTASCLSQRRHVRGSLES